MADSTAGCCCRANLKSFASSLSRSAQLSLSWQGIKIKHFVKSVGRTVKPALQARSSGYFFCASRINRYIAAFPQYLVVENELVLVFNNTNRNAKLHGNARLSFLNPASMFFKKYLFFLRYRFAPQKTAIHLAVAAHGVISLIFRRKAPFSRSFGIVSSATSGSQYLK